MRHWLCAILLASLLCAAPPNPVTWKLDGVPAKGVKPGAKFALRLAASIETGWHVYSMKPMPDGPVAMRIWTAEGQPFLLDGSIRAPRPETLLDPNFNMEVEFYQGEAVFGLPLKVVSGTEAGAHTLTVNASYQSCDSHMCLPPRTVQITVAVDVRR